MKTYGEYRRERELFESATPHAVDELSRAHSRDEAAARNDINLREIQRRGAGSAESLRMLTSASAASRQSARKGLVSSANSLHATESAWQSRISQVPRWRRVIWGARYSLSRTRAKPRR